MKGLPGDWSGLVVFCAGTALDGHRLPDQHIAERLVPYAPVLYVDPPEWRGRGASLGRLQLVEPGLARLTPSGVPGIERPVLNRVNDALVRRSVRAAVDALGATVQAVVLASCHDLMSAVEAPISVFYGTDDFVAGSPLARIPEARLRRQEAKHLREANRIVAVSTALAQNWEARGYSVELIPNGVDSDLFAATDVAPLPDDVELPGPVVGFVGQLADRIDLSMLEVVADRGHALLLVGPHHHAFAIERVEHLLARPNVQWVGNKPFESLPSYLRVCKVGITPYTTSSFNEASFPLKTLEYLAAGRAVVASDLPAVRWLDTDLVRIASTASEFADQVTAALDEPSPPELVARRRAFAHAHRWEARAEQFARLLELEHHALAHG